MDALSILALAKQCASSAPAVVIASIALVETGGHPNAVYLSGDDARTVTFEQAVKTATSAAASGEPPSVGMTLLPAHELSTRGISISSGLSACTNLKIAGELVRLQFDSINGKSDADWRRAAIGYGTGNPDAAEVNNYGARYDAARMEIEDASKGQGLGATVSEAPTPTQTRVVSRNQPAVEPAEGEAPGHTWDVFGRNQGRLLRFSN